MGAHDVVQTRTRRLETTAGLRVVAAAYQAHELGHGVAVVPRRPEGVLSHEPAGRENDEVGNGGAGVVGGPRQHGVNGGVGVVEGDRADGVEASEIVLERVVIAVPGDNVEGAVVLARGEQGVVEFAVQLVLFLAVVEISHRCLEVSGIGEAVGSNGAQLGKLVVALVELADVASHWTCRQSNTVSTVTFVVSENGWWAVFLRVIFLPDTPRDDTDLIRTNHQSAQLGLDVQNTVLRDNQEVPISRVEGLLPHVLASRI